jgi:hypothetical protein
MNIKTTKIDNEKIDLSLNSKGPRQEHKNQIQKHKLCKTKTQTNFYYNEVSKDKHKKNITRL